MHHSKHSLSLGKFPRKVEQHSRRLNVPPVEISKKKFQDGVENQILNSKCLSINLVLYVRISHGDLRNTQAREHKAHISSSKKNLSGKCLPPGKRCGGIAHDQSFHLCIVFDCFKKNIL